MLRACTAAAGLALAAPALAQQSTVIDLTNVRIQNGLNQFRSSDPNTISPAYKYHYDIQGMVRGSGIILGGLFPNPVPLAQALETLSPGSSAFLSGDVYNCQGTHPVGIQGETIAGSTVLAGINVNYSITISTGIDASNFAYFNLTNVVLTPALLVGSLTFTSGSATVSRLYYCQANCDESTTPPVLNVADFTCFLGKYAAGDPTANCDCSTSEPALNVGDFTCFLTKYAQGCPPP